MGRGEGTGLNHRIQWPEGKDFAFTIFDDTDRQTLDNASEVYAFLADLGFRTTKSVWPLRGKDTPTIGGMTCEDPKYLEWVLKLKEEGFEIGLHNVTYHTSRREETIRGIERFYELFGYYPYSMSNHTGCYEGIYWGNARLTGIHEMLYNLLLLNRNKSKFQGHIESSPLFWGDMCRAKIKYVRNFVFKNINSLKMCPFMPYHDRDRPYVNYWFASSDGPEVHRFNSIIQTENQECLAAEGGACIMYTHLACGFYENGQIHPHFKFLMKRMSRMNGWFVPVNTLLDHILKIEGHREITPYERNRLEIRWLIHKLLLIHGTS